MKIKTNSFLYITILICSIFSTAAQSFTIVSNIKKLNANLNEWLTDRQKKSGFVEGLYTNLLLADIAWPLANILEVSGNTFIQTYKSTPNETYTSYCHKELSSVNAENASRLSVRTFSGTDNAFHIGSVIYVPESLLNNPYEMQKVVLYLGYIALKFHMPIKTISLISAFAAGLTIYKLEKTSFTTRKKLALLILEECLLGGLLAGYIIKKNNALEQVEKDAEEFVHERMHAMQYKYINKSN